MSAGSFADSGLDPPGLDQALKRSLERATIRDWQPWQWRSLWAVAALAALVLFVLARTLALTPSIDLQWRADSAKQIRLAPGRPGLPGVPGSSRVREIASAGDPPLPVDAFALLRAPRWALEPVSHANWLELQKRLHDLLQQDRLTLRFEAGREASVQPRSRGYAGLGATWWLCASVALALLLAGCMVILSRPNLRGGLYLLMVCAQAANLLAIGIENLPGLGMPMLFARYGHMARMAFDLLTIGAIVQLATLQPLRLPAARSIAMLSWASLAAVLGIATMQTLEVSWWWAQCAVLGGGLLVIALLSWSYHIQPNPYAVQMRRYAIVGEVTVLLLSLAALAASRAGAMGGSAASAAALIWYLFLACLLLLLPFLSRTRQLTRELAVLALACTVATSLELLVSTLTPASALASIALSIALSLGAVALTRRWLLQPMAAGEQLSAERMFEWLYRMVREVEAQPQDSAALLTHFLHELFEPMDTQVLQRRPDRSRVLGDGAALLVPVPDLGTTPSAAVRQSVLLRFAGQGRRLFTLDDARLTDRVVEQLRRAAAYDKAVEHGRNEERARIAQDLHDDIGARLLTLMYKAQDPEIEDYIRHTLKDLKTLTRGLAATDHRLSHAIAEWKADVAQRLTAAQIELDWSFTYDRDIVLSVVQWSALTRVLRELVSNAIQHSCATQLEIAATLQAGQLRLSFIDDGIGRAPQAWAHGLGLGGVRKRVKLLGGEVHWRENGERGIACVVLLPSMEPQRG